MEAANLKMPKHKLNNNFVFDSQYRRYALRDPDSICDCRTIASASRCGCKRVEPLWAEWRWRHSAWGWRWRV